LRLSRDPAARRRLAALGGVAALAFAGGAAVGAGNGPGGGVGERAQVRAADLGRLTLRQRVGQLLVLSFRGTLAPTDVRKILAEDRAAGVILFGRNVGSPAQLRGLTRSLQRSAGGGALVATDQEGGPVRILPWAAPGSGQPAQGTRAGARSEAAAAARDLRAAGVNVNLAPVADVAGPGTALRGRAYPGGGERVSGLVAAATAAYRRGGVAATVKHFPGLGAAERNTDDAAVTIADGRAAIEARDLPPFRAAIDAGVPLVMAAHALYPAYDRIRIASQSPVLLRELLRERLGFRGVVISDSIEAEAVVSRSPVETAAVRSVDAGVDLVLMTGAGTYTRVYRRLLAAARRSSRFRRRVDEAAARVLALKRELGLRAPAG
jgi:beta-N-acetylhexosaminidase